MLVSIIIPVRNAAAHIEPCLGQLALQDYPHHKMEIIIADGASTDGTPLLAESIKCDDISVKVLKLKITGRSAGLNAAIKSCTGDAICRLDVRTRISPNYISKCVKVLITSGAANVGGIQTPCGSTTIQRAIGLAMIHPFGVGNAKFRVGRKSGFVDTVYPGFFRRSIFEKIGFFDESGGLLSEDSDMNQRIRASGEQIVLDIDIVAGYEPRNSILEHGRLYFRYGMARIGNRRKHGSLTSWRQLAAPLFIAVLVGSCGLGFIWYPFYYVFAAICTLYCFCVIVFSIQLSIRHSKVRELPYLFLIFPSMHVGWGLGFWYALIHSPKSDEHVSV